MLSCCCSSFRSDSLALFRCFAHNPSEVPVCVRNLLIASAQEIFSIIFTLNRPTDWNHFSIYCHNSKEKITIARSDVNSHMVFEIRNLHLITKQRQQKEQSSLLQRDSHAVHFSTLSPHLSRESKCLKGYLNLIG